MSEKEEYKHPFELDKEAVPDEATEEDYPEYDRYMVRKDYRELFPDEYSDIRYTTEIEDWEAMAEWMNDNPYEEVEEEVEVEPEVHIPTVMSKLKGSVDIPEEFKFTNNLTFYTMLRNIFRGKSILVLGPSGCGKSSLGKILADITNKPFYAFNFGDTMNPAAKILGDTKYDSDKGTWFKPSRFGITRRKGCIYHDG